MSCALKLAEENHILRAVIVELEQEVTGIWGGPAWLQKENAQPLSHLKEGLPLVLNRRQNAELKKTAGRNNRAILA